ncbi:trypsin-like peptidase domain-containing protein [Frateuria aurantia]
MRGMLAGLSLLLGLSLPLPGQAQTPGLAYSAPAPAIAGLPDFTSIVERNAPAVVHIEAHYDGHDPSGTESAQARRQLEILQQLFGPQGVPVPRDPPQTALGSGFIISSDGYILTNNHVVKGASAVTVRLQDHRRLTARVVGTDTTYDIALLKVDAGKPLPAVVIGDSHRLKAGQWVLAIGSPFGFDYTVTQGIVSAVGRHLGQGDQPWVAFIQTDVPINRGNSGGPLFNLQGQVVGINSQIYSNTGGYQGVAFSIPIDVAMQAAEQLKRNGFVSRGVLGVLVQPVDQALARRLGLPDANGALVRSVALGSGAARAGVQPGDVIRAYNGQSIYDGSDLPPLVGASAVGRQARLTLWRDGKAIELPVVVGAMPRDPQDGVPPMLGGPDRLGLQVEPLDASALQQLGAGAAGGVVIRQVAPGPAEHQGLQAGDIILRFNRQPVASVEAYRRAVAALKPGATVLVLIWRDGQQQFVAITPPAS